jgi:hypothetical protein
MRLTSFALCAMVLVVSCISGGGAVQDPREPNAADWAWTGDARGGGNQEKLTTQGDTVTIGPVDHVHFVNKAQTYGAGKYSFKYRGTNFKFAWRISPSDPTKGSALILQKAPGESFALIHVVWDGFFYGWHNASNQFRNTVALTPTSTDWHSVEISDNGSALVVKFDGATLDLFSTPNKSAADFLSDVGTGFIGIGNNDQSAIRLQGIQVSN